MHVGSSILVDNSLCKLKFTKITPPNDKEASKDHTRHFTAGTNKREKNWIRQIEALQDSAHTPTRVTNVCDSLQYF